MVAWLELDDFNIPSNPSCSMTLWYIQVGRDLRKFLVQPPTQRRVSWEIRAAELYSLGSSKPPRMARAQIPWACCPHGDFIVSWKVYLKGVILLALLRPVSPVIMLALGTWRKRLFKKAFFWTGNLSYIACVKNLTQRTLILQTSMSYCYKNNK